jgi:phosphoenolpyruvate carboxykinase (ATP)
MSNFTQVKEHINLTVSELLKCAQANGEGVFTEKGAFSVVTGKRTGRSPRDRFIVCDDITRDFVEWGAVNQKTTQAHFDQLWQKAINHMQDGNRYVSELQVGADTNYGVPVRVITELAWHNVFCNHLFVSPRSSQLKEKREWTLLNAATLILDPLVDGTPDDGAVMINFSERKVLLCGMLYAGEMKKAMFSALNFMLPQVDVLPMHCAANRGEQGDVSLFFGLSGTGKTTLSADPSRYLIGDDEHGWSETGVFNFEGGCYAKCIDLSREREPVIWDAIKNGAILENVVLDSMYRPDFSDSSYTKNTRSGYPRHHIEKRVESNCGALPQAVIFLTCDLYGVLPPVGLLTLEQAAYYFLSGYTALVGSTEVGTSSAIQPTFSTCFGAPFFPRPANEYAELLMKRVKESNSPVYLVNTGWTGGSYGQGGKRFAIPTTRRVVDAAITGELIQGDFSVFPGFGFMVPERISGVDDSLLSPAMLWGDDGAYKEKANLLIAQFQENFKRFTVDPRVLEAGPSLIE